MNITIKQPEENDIYGIQQVFYKSWLHTYPNKEAGITIEDIEHKFKDAFTEETLQKRKTYLLNLPADVRFSIAKDASQVVGICWQMKKVDANLLQALYVLPQYQGKGIGYRLWQDALSYFGTNKDIIIQVATYNTKAIAFYKKLGFIDTGKLYSEERHRMKSGAQITGIIMIFR